jgi:hypothetical protein
MSVTLEVGELPGAPDPKFCSGRPKSLHAVVGYWPGSSVLLLP